MNRYALASAPIIILLWLSSSHGFSVGVSFSRPVPTLLGDTKSSDQDPVKMARLRLEMHWTLEEAKEDCLVEDPKTCGSEECSHCSGVGKHVCRFCRGTLQNYIHGQFLACPVCNKGMETCRSCQGTGWIAEWTKLSKNEEEETLMP